MSNYFILDGRPSTDFDCWIADSSAFDGAEMDLSSVEIPGRNGELTLNNHRFKAVAYEVTAYVPRNMQDNVPSLRAWLQANGARKSRYEEYIRPDEYMRARFTGAFKIDQSDRTGATMKLSFIRDPQRFLKLGEAPIGLVEQAHLYNPTMYEAKPKIRAYGTGTLQIGKQTMTITDADEYTDIDCERMDAYKGSNNCNGNIILNGCDFPVLPVGEFYVKATGFSKVEITPNWWTI